MAPPAFPLVLAYALMMLSLWAVDLGLVGRPFLTPSNGSNAGARSFAPSKALNKSHSQVYGLPATPKQSASDTWAAVATEAQNEQVRRMAAIALIVYGSRMILRTIETLH
jgi:hypothetical protein